MCYLIVRDSRQKGCYALTTEHGKKLAEYKKFLQENFIQDDYNIELVTLSRPSAYGEYEPYTMIDTELEFTEKVKSLC